MKEKSTVKRDKRAMRRLFVYGVCAVAVFCVTLWLLVASLGRVDGRQKTSQSTPTALVSVGAPRSQLDLKRMFSRMSDSYYEGERRVYEPITLSHRETVSKRVESGESIGLSVEEVIYVISDSVTAYGEYDVINLVGRNGEADLRIYPERELINGYEPYHVTASERIDDITEIILYRLSALSSSDRVRKNENGYVYVPNSPSRDNGEKLFIIDLTEGETENRIVFCPDGVRQIEVFPYPSLKDDAASTVIRENPRRATEDEAELLRLYGYDPSDCRNITPKHWYEYTELRLFVSGGRVVILDPGAKKATDTLPTGHKFTSAAICGDGEVKLYFTSSYTDGSSLLCYSAGEITEIYKCEYEYLGVYESLDGESVELYEADKKENAKYMTQLTRRGECLWMGR